VTTTYKILYWQEVPSQIRAEDERDEITVELPPRFMERIDRLAAQRGLQGTDDYLAQWNWGEDTQREGSAHDVAQAVRAELDADARW
jgi:cvfA/B/C family virulence factor